METTIKGLLQNVWQPQLQFVRYRGKINITKPRPPHFKRAVVETICVPYFQEKKRPAYIPNYDVCFGNVTKIEEKPDHPLEIIMGKQSLNWFKNSKMIAFYHLNSPSSEERFKNQLMTKKNGMKLFFFNNSILRKGLKGSIFESINQLLEGPTATIFSQDINISSLIKLSKKLQKLVLMGAIVEDKLLSCKDLEHCGKFESLEAAQSHLVTFLNLAPQSFVQNITHHPSNLVGLLNEHKKLLKDGD